MEYSVINSVPRPSQPSDPSRDRQGQSKDTQVSKVFLTTAFTEPYLNPGHTASDVSVTVSGSGTIQSHSGLVLCSKCYKNNPCHPIS
ncbi:hypothetical protein NFI96_033575, partial [Prochilodus magdalenae]